MSDPAKLQKIRELVIKLEHEVADCRKILKGDLHD
jgi:hypothetical protein